MAKFKRHRRRWRRHLRFLLFTILILGALPGLALTAATGQLWSLLAIPLGMAGVVVAVPFLVLALVSAAVPLLAVVAVLGFPLYLMYRLMVANRQDAGPAPSPEVFLRRRYVAGELTYQQFQAEMVGLLKEHFARGEMSLSQYEAELERLLEPVRRLDVARDPTLAGARHHQ